MTQPLLKAVPSGIDVTSEHNESVAKGIGATLKSMREGRSLSLNDVSARLKFSVRQIDALENEDWDLLPRGLPLRGMVKNYARYLEADIQALMTLFDTQPDAPSQVPELVSSSSAIGPVDLPLQEDIGQRSWGWLIAILVLLIAAAFYAIERGWIPDSWLIADWLKSLRK